MSLGLGLGLGLSTRSVGGAAALTGQEPLSDVLDSASCDLDATISDSYGGSGQTWSNLITSPSVGSQTDYDFFLGPDGEDGEEDPTFTGSAGDEGAYFALDGGNYFTCKTTSGTVLQRANMTSGTGSGPVWFGFIFRLGAIDTTISFFGNTAGATVPGVRFLMNTTENLRLLQGGDSSGYNQPIVPNDTWAAATDYLFLVTLDSTNAGSEKYWINSTTGSSWNTAYSPATSTSESGNAMRLGTDSGANFIMPNNSRIKGFYCGNELLDDTKATSIIEHLELRHNADYTP